MIDSTVLLAGGAVAALAGFWSQAKSFISYISSFIVLRINLDYYSSRSLRLYLKRNYKVAPTGQLHYCIQFFQNRDTNIHVPFKLLDSRTIFYKGFKILYAHQNSSGLDMTVLAIRGTVDIELLLSEALDFTRKLDELTDSMSTNFCIVEVVGAEKSFGGLKSDRPSGIPGPLPNEQSSIALPLDLQIDKSFKYGTDKYFRNINENPFDQLYYDEAVMRNIEQASLWMLMKSWYEERSIPWRRGWLLHGPGGTGKSSLAKAVAQRLRIPLYQYQLATMSDQELIKEWKEMSTPSVVLFEDFDTVFNKRQPVTQHKLLTFDTVLNLISGVNTMHGLFLIVTTNNIEMIDEALGVDSRIDGISTRPGRIDTVIHLGIMSVENKTKMAERVLKDLPEIAKQVVESSGDCTASQFQEALIQRAFEEINKTQGAT